MSECTLKERLQCIAIGLGMTVFLLVVGWCAVAFTCATSNSILNYASSRPDSPMMDRSVFLTALDADSRAAQPGHKND